MRCCWGLGCRDDGDACKSFETSNVGLTFGQGIVFRVNVD